MADATFKGEPKSTFKKEWKALSDHEKKFWGNGKDLTYKGFVNIQQNLAHESKTSAEKTVETIEPHKCSLDDQDRDLFENLKEILGGFAGERFGKEDYYGELEDTE
jgi:hypothetical protein